MEYILCSAVHYKNGVTYIHQPSGIESGHVVCGRRHHNCFMTNFILSADGDMEKFKVVESTQGFVTSLNRYVGREEGLSIARQAGQMLNDSESKYMLYSEDLW